METNEIILSVNNLPDWGSEFSKLATGTVGFASKPVVKDMGGYYEVEYVFVVRGPMIGEGI